MCNIDRCVFNLLPFDPLASVFPTGLALPGVGRSLVQRSMDLYGEARAYQRKTWYSRLTRLVLSLEFSRSGGDGFLDCRVLSKPFGCNPLTVHAFGLNRGVRREYPTYG